MNITTNQATQRATETGPSQKPKPAINCYLAALLVSLAGFLLAGCSTSFDQTVNDSLHDDGAYAGSPAYATNYLREGDTVSISFQYSTNYNTVQKIGLDKMLNLQGVGQVKAAGESVLQLQDQLTELYKTLAKDDPIIVRLVATENCVYVIGAVNHPGQIPMDRPMTVLEAIMEAGGYDPDRAKLSDVWVLRIEDDKQKAYQLDLNRVLSGKDDQVFYLKPFDIVRVPTKTFNY